MQSFECTKTYNSIKIKPFISQSGKSVLEYQNQAKMLFRKLGPHSPPRCSIETGPYLFQYVLKNRSIPFEFHQSNQCGVTWSNDNLLLQFQLFD